MSYVTKNMIQSSMSLKVLILPLALAITVMMMVFFIKPSYSEMSAVKEEVDQKKIQLNNLKNRNEKLQNLKSRWESLTEERALVASALPEIADVDSFISEVTSKASRSGILLNSIDIGKDKSVTESFDYICGANQADSIQYGADLQSQADTSSKSCLETVDVSLTMAGSWEQLLEFFKYLEEMNRINNIKAALLAEGNQMQSESPNDILKAEISMTAFYKSKSRSVNEMLTESLASQESFNQKAIEKLKETIYSPYEAPGVDPGGERNIFK